MNLPASHCSGTPPESTPPWWRGAVLYQVYPRSFADSNGDGLGDLPGLTQRLDAIADLGVDGIWLSPVFRSPMRDFGYDVSDHRDIEPCFGTLRDFDALLQAMHARGLRLLIDQVWSHTAAEHAWFAASRASRTGPFADWYVWADARPDGSPPNNWQSWMGGPAWTWEPRRRQYYLHNFLPQMPDLNFHCAAVQDAILNLARFWLDRGVDGFRLDTANLYFHDRALRDNPPLPEADRGDCPVLMQRHVFNADQPETPRFLERVRALMDRYADRFAVAEVGGAQAYAQMIEYTRATAGLPARLHAAYSFSLLGAQHAPAHIAEQLHVWEGDAARDAWPAWALSNHDVPRVVTRWSQGGASFSFGAAADNRAGETPGEAAADETSDVERNERARLYLALLLCLRGTVFIYQGEELGLPQSTVAFEDLQDPFGKAHWPTNPGRDGCRTPMPWVHDAAHGGFTAPTARPWLPVDERFRALSMDLQRADPQSTWHCARRLIALRRSQALLRTGALHCLHHDAQTLLIGRGDRDPQGHTPLLAAFNLSEQPARVVWPSSAQPAHTLFSLGPCRRSEEHIDLPPRSVWIGSDSPSTPPSTPP
ncbi:hypothetical protein IP84_04020 [beta proteobacterium AAP99]|nr:hypothetical protein IP84_04020 [beta proteobacterium AAP99]